VEFLLTFIGTVAAIMASFFSWLGYVISKRAAERARPCIGESVWSETSDSYFVTLKIFPGQYFVQTKSIEVAGARLSYARDVSGNGCLLSSGEEISCLPYTVSVPVNRDIVELKVCITPKPKVPFGIKVNLAGDHKPLIYHVYENPSTFRKPCDKV
jgi:hypothetical protein